MNNACIEPKKYYIFKISSLIDVLLIKTCNNDTNTTKYYSC